MSAKHTTIKHFSRTLAPLYFSLIVCALPIQATEVQDRIVQGDEAYVNDNMAQALVCYQAALVLAEQGKDKGLIPTIRERIAKLQSQKLGVESNMGGSWGRVAPSSAMPARINRGSSIENKAFARRSEKHQAALLLVDEGRRYYAAGKYEEALQSYKKALDTIPNAPVNDKERRFISESMGDASVAVARDYAKVGRYDEAKKLLDDALKIDPSNKYALLEMERLADPIRNNPAMTPQLAKNVNEVNRLLHMGYGYYDLGQFDEARLEFQKVLAIDKYNTAAQAGLEAVNRRRTTYYKQAYNTTRGSMLADVDSMWALPQNNIESPIAPVEMLTPVTGDEQTTRALSAKLDSIIIPSVQLEDVTLQEAVEYIRSKAVELDSAAGYAAERGINILINLGDSPKAREVTSKTFTLQMEHVPLRTVLTYMAKMTGTQLVPSMYAAEFMLQDEESTIMMTKTIKVPPNFMSKIASGSDNAEQSGDDVFGDTSSQVKVKRTNVKAALQNNGIAFPEGASVQYLPSSSSLIVRNTANNIAGLEDFVRATAVEGEVMVRVTTTFIVVNENKLDELGFDWIANFNIDPGKMYGGGGGNPGSPPYAGIPVIPGAPGLPPGSITGGLRTSHMTTTDPITTMIQGGTSAIAHDIGTTPAPSIFSIRGVWSSADITMVMRGLDQKKGVDLLQSPSILVKPGQKAVIYSGRELIYPTAYEPAQIPENSDGPTTARGAGTSISSPITPAHPTDFETQKLGVNVEVDIVGISADKRVVNVNINPEAVELEGFINYGSPIMAPAIDGSGNLAIIEVSKNELIMPVFKKVRTATGVLPVASGTTVVIGKLEKAKIVKVEDKIPILGDLPLVGRLFRSNSKHEEKNVTLILLKTEVIDASGQLLFGNEKESTNTIQGAEDTSGIMTPPIP